MKPTPPPKRWKGVGHCQRNATRHGAYSAQVFSARAYLRALDSLLTRLEAEVQANCETGLHLKRKEQSMGPELEDDARCTRLGGA